LLPPSALAADPTIGAAAAVALLLDADDDLRLAASSASSSSSSASPSLNAFLAGGRPRRLGSPSDVGGGESKNELHERTMQSKPQSDTHVQKKGEGEGGEKTYD
jgi:hypothetical protein